MTALPAASPVLPRTAVDTALRRLAAALTAGALLGALVGGVGGRLAMMLLARANPTASGVVSDDGFEMGRLTTSGTVNLLLVGAVLGTLGGVIYLALRGLMIGPRWFQVLSISVGPAVVVGSMLVHPDGVDFTLLEPLALPVALFVVIPGAFAALMTVLGERWLADGSWFGTARLPLVLPLLLLGAPLAPLLAALGGGWLVLGALRRHPRGAAVLAHPAVPWTLRAGLAGAFTVSLANLVQDLVLLA